MIKLFSINRENKIHYLIEVGEEFFVHEDEFIRLEFGRGFDWIKHSITCPDCRAFLDSLFNEKTAFNWYMKSESGTFILDTSEFAKDDHYINSFESRNSREFSGVRLKLKKIAEDFDKLDDLRIRKEEEEKYEHCAEIKNAIKISRRQ